MLFLNKEINMTIRQLQNAIEFTKSQKGFAGFPRPIEEQICVVSFDRIYWQKDVSNGCGQAFLLCWTKVSDFPQ